MKIALIEPPGRKMIMRDMYSSTISKLGYSWPNVDLLSLSGILRKNFDCKIFDFNARGLSPREATEKISAFRPDHVVFAFGESNANDDMKFARLVKTDILPEKGKILGTGGSLIHNTKRFMDNENWLDGVILNYVHNGLASYFMGMPDALNLVVRTPDNDIREGNRQNAPMGFEIAPGRHEDLSLNNYFLPQLATQKFTSISTSWGCPYKCSFCVSSTLNYGMRSARSIFEEIEYCQQLGINGFFLRDNVFGVNKKQLKELGSLIAEHGKNIHFISDARTDFVDEETIELYKRIGTGALNFGIESVKKETLDLHRKGLKKDNAREVLAMCRAHNITTTGYFILGLPGETEADIKNTIDYSCDLPLSYASFNLPIPIVGTEMRRKAVVDGIISDDIANYDGGGQSIIPNENIDLGRLKYLHRRAYLRFYLRPAVIASTVRQNVRLSKLKKLLKALLMLFPIIARQ